MKFQVSLPIAADHAAYAGHFPNFPVCPGAVLLDEVLIHLQQAGRVTPREWRIAGAKFIDSVRPGDQPVVEFETAADAASIHFTMRVADRTVVTGTLARLTPGATA